MENLRIDTADFVVRERYLGAIEAFIDQPVVKVLKGMRRVGKSVIMRLLIERLIESGVPAANILYINKESLEFDALKDYRDLYRYAVDYFKAGATAASQSTMVRQAHHDTVVAPNSLPLTPDTSLGVPATATGRKYILIDENQEIEG